MRKYSREQRLPKILLPKLVLLEFTIDKNVLNYIYLTKVAFILSKRSQSLQPSMSI